MIRCCTQIWAVKWTKTKWWCPNRKTAMTRGQRKSLALSLLCVMAAGLCYNFSILNFYKFYNFYKLTIIFLFSPPAPHRHSGPIGNSSSNEKPFACPVPGCKKRYKNVNGIKYHSKNGHKKDGKWVYKKFTCAGCMQVCVWVCF